MSENDLADDDRCAMKEFRIHCHAYEDRMTRNDLNDRSKTEERTSVTSLTFTDAIVGIHDSIPLWILRSHMLFD